MTERWDAVVVGAGPAGATSALLLARAGARVLLLDRARFPRDKPCSEYLSPATTAILARLGQDVLDAVERAVHAKLYGMKVVAPGGAVVCGRFVDSPRPYSFALPRTTFDAILVSAAARAGAVVREGVMVEDLICEGRAVVGVLGRTGDGAHEALRARVTIGADGLRSVVARRLGLVRTAPPRRVAFTAHVAEVAGVDGVGELHVSDRGYVGLGPVGDGITTVALVVPVRRLRRLGGGGRRLDFFAELDRFPGLSGRFDRRRLVRDVLATGPFGQWSRTAIAPGGGALLVGDAADFFDPFTGQGIHAALRGAELVADSVIPALARGAGEPIPAAMLRPYAQARRRTFLGKWLFERLIGVGVGSPALTDRVVRRLARRPALADLLVSAAGNTVPVRRVLAPSVLTQLIW